MTCARCGKTGCVMEECREADGKPDIRDPPRWTVSTCSVCGYTRCVCTDVEKEEAHARFLRGLTQMQNRVPTPGNEILWRRCNVCGADSPALGAHECMRINGAIARWETDPDRPGTHRLVPIAATTKESALAEILPILARLHDEDRQRVVDALVALTGAP